MRPIDADALMDDIKRDSKKAIKEGDKVGSFWLGYFAGSVIKQPPIQSELDLKTLIRTIETGITATNTNDAYSLGMRNGMRWCKSLIDGVEPKFEDVVADTKDQPTIQPVATDTNVGDTISRRQAIDEIKNYCENGCDIAEDNWCPSCQREQFMKLLKALPTVQPEPKWIPVSERLPKTEEFVLASLTGKYRNTTFEHACEIADYADGEWCVYAYPGMSAEKCAELIEAWMPLPEPYKPNNKQSGKEGA